MRNPRPKTSDYVKLQRSREARLWIVQTATIIGGIVLYGDSHPEFKQKVRDIFQKAKSRFTGKKEEAHE